MDIISKDELYVDKETGEIITPISLSNKDEYLKNHIRWVEPMTAKEYKDEKQLEEMLNSNNYIAEEKLDGTRATLHIGETFSRVFSRRVSKKTNWFVENTDSLPQLKEVCSPEFKDTILDGEMKIDGKEFKEVASTLNCTWDNAIEKQLEYGFITLHAFDIIYYKGIYIAKMPLWKRKKYLEKVINGIKNKYVVNVPYTVDTILVNITSKMVKDYFYNNLSKEVYPNLYNNIDINCTISTIQEFKELENTTLDFSLEIDKKTWYEYILYNGGEGLMLKPINGQYFHKRGREYTKWKKYLTRDCIILGFTEPTKEYEGKLPETWEYWCDKNNNIYIGENNKDDLMPVTKFYAKKWVGNLIFGVIISQEELLEWKKKNPKENPQVYNFTIGDKTYSSLVVGECSGFDEKQREDFTNNKQRYRGTVVEIVANEIYKKTGKLRHPRFLRCRADKSALQCKWEDHIRG